MSAVSLQKISFQYPNRFALRDIDLEIRENELVLFYGPNGSGKTTLLRLIATLVPPSSGMATILGHPHPDERLKIRPRLSALFAESYLFDDLTVEENLVFYSRLYRKKAPFEELERFGMSAFRNARVRELSRGERQKVALVRALLPDSFLLLLDEPTAALDAAATETLSQLLKELKSKRTILCATHDSHFLEGAADRKIKMDGGRI